MSDRKTYLAVLARLDANDKLAGEPECMEHDSQGRAEKWLRTRILGRGGRCAQVVVRVTGDRCEVSHAGGIVRPAEVWDAIERFILLAVEGIIRGIRERWEKADRAERFPTPPPEELGKWKADVAAAAEWARRDIESQVGTASFGPNCDLENPPEPTAGVQWVGPDPTATMDVSQVTAVAAHVRHNMLPEDTPENIGEIVIGVIDTGCRNYHTSLTGMPIEVIDCTGRGGHDADQNGHGTAVTSQIVGRYVGGEPLGAAMGAKVVVAGVLDSRSGSGLDSWIARGVRACVKAGCRVINASLGGDSPLPETEKAIEEARRRGVLVVAAAGNGGPGKGDVSYPARYPICLAVSAVNDSDAYAGFSQRGDGEDISARGVNQLVAVGGSMIGMMSGTSMAAPHVPAAAARVLAVYDELAGGEVDAERVATLLRDAGEVPQLPGGGAQPMPLILNCGDAIELIPAPAPVDPPPPTAPDVSKLIERTAYRWAHLVAVSQALTEGKPIPKPHPKAELPND